MKRILAALLLATTPATAGALRIDHIAITVADLARTEAFYRDGIGFRTVTPAAPLEPAAARLLGVPDSARSITMQLGAEKVQFIQYAHPGRPMPPDSKSVDFWFQHFAIVVSDMGAAYHRLQHVAFHPVSIGGPQILPDEDGRVGAFKFRDPDGHPLEFLYFPPGQGRSVWHTPGEAGPTIGIDHTAISVSATPASLAFYQGLLGMSIAYKTVNRGPIQDHLDGTFDTMVRITGLRPASAEGPGIELLDYRAPPTARPAPADSNGADIWHVHAVLRVNGLAALAAALQDAGVRFVSPGVVTLGDGTKACEVLDPDRHAILLEE
jgi:catechol 2,3-dioxygenase-like lactoylglutathione lyase family enzyme